MKRNGWLWPVLGALALGGCASMSESQCRVADWYRVGLDDGASGVEPGRVADYAEDCGKIGVRPDTRAYRQGWDQGIQSFCTPANGWQQGVQGRSGKDKVCVGQIGYTAFQRNLQAGLEVYRTNERIRQNNDEIRRLQKKLETAKDDTERQALRRELSAIDREQYRLRVQLGQQQQLAP
ncbi:MAG: DUF2799 domain-containing protein [Rhodoferax sp.]